MTIALSSLRVGAEFDSSGYDAGMRRKIAADEAGSTSSLKVAGALDKGTAASARFEAAVKRQEQAARAGITTADQQARAVANLAGKYGQQADAASLSAAGCDRLADAIAGLSAAQAAQLAQTERLAAAANRSSAANDNQVREIGAVGEAFRSATKFAAEHPVLVLAGSVLAARALSGYAATAAGAMGRASVATAAYAAEAGAMGTGVVAAANLAAAGLKLGERAALSASAGLGTYAEKVSTLTTGTSLLTRGLGMLPAALAPLAVAFGVFLVASSVINKAYADLDRLVQLGERAERLDVGAPFLKSFEAVGPALRASVEDMQKALAQASGFVQDKFGEFNALEKRINELRDQGYGSAGLEGARQQASTANTTEDRIKAAVAAMKELEASGYRFAAIDLANGIFGPTVADRLRQNQLTAAQFAADLDAAAAKEVTRQEDVTRALEQARAIEAVKNEISEAWKVSLDFSDVAYAINQGWLNILGTVRDVVVWINNATAAAGNLATTLSDKVYDLAKRAGIAGNWGLTGEGVVDLPKGGTPPLTMTVKPQADNSGRFFPYTFDAQVQAWKKYTDAANRGAAATRDAGAAQGQASDAFDNALQRLKDQTAELRLQADMAGKNTEEVYKLTEANRLWRAARQAGRQDEEGMAAAIDEASAAYARQHVETDRVLEAQRRLRDGQRETAQAFTSFAEDVITGSGKMSEAFASLGKQFVGVGLKGLMTGEGAFGTALGLGATEKNGLGGLFGSMGGSATGVFGRLFGGSGSATEFDTSALSQSDRDTFFGGASAFRDATREGTASGLMDGLKTLFGGGTDGAAKAGGGSIAGGFSGVLALASSYSVGRSSGSMTQGALGGALSGAVGGAQLGAMLPVPGGALIGAAAGTLFGGLLGIGGAQEAEKQRKRQEKVERFERFADALPEIHDLDRTLRGDAQGDLAKTITDAADATAKAAKVAADAGQTQIANDLNSRLLTFEARMRNLTASGLGETIELVRQGFGTSNAFTEGRQNLITLGDGLKGFLADVAQSGASVETYARAVNASVDAAARSLSKAPEMTEVQRQFETLKGAALGLADTLDRLGVSAQDSARIVQDSVDRAFREMQATFQGDLTRKIDDAQGRGYSNDIRDLLKEVAGLRSDAGTLGVGGDQVETYFTAAAQKIVDGAELTGEAFTSLVAFFPELNGRVHEFQAALTSASSAAEIAARKLGFQDRLFAATNDTSTLAGQLAAFDRQAQREREEEVKAGGQALTDLEAAQYAERLKIVRDYSDQAAEAEAQRYEEAQKAFDAFARNIRQYVDGLRAGSSSPLSPQDRLTAAQGLYDAQLALAKTGDRTALDGITGYASDLLDAAKAFYASSSQYQAVFQSVTGQLTALPTQVSPEQFIVDAVKASGASIVSATDLMRATLLAGVQANSPGLIANALYGNFSMLDTSVNGLLDFNELRVGLGPLATASEQAAARAIFNSIDADGDGQLSKLELLRASSGRLEGFTDSTRAAAAQTQAAVDYQTSIVNSQSSLLASIDSLSGQINSWSKAAVNSVDYGNQFLNSINVLNASMKVNSDTMTGRLDKINNNLVSANQKNGAIYFLAGGGWVGGVGTATSDSNPAMLSRGEFVVNAQAAGTFGAALEAMNDNRSFSLPSVPVLYAVAPSIDLSPVVAAIRRLEDRIGVLEANLAAATGAGAVLVREGVDVVATGQRRAASDAVQASLRPRRAGSQAA